VLTDLVGGVLHQDVDQVRVLSECPIESVINDYDC
jgi:hypothetical protein